MINVNNLTKKYGDRAAVRQVSFQVPKGEIVGFLGPNGAGKTTTLRMLTGYLAPDDGTVLIDGIDAVADPVTVRKRIGYMPEAVPLYKELRVSEYLRYRARLKGVGRKQVKESVSISMEKAKITDVSTRIIGQLSRGYRTRVGLADALVANPSLLILDEPTAGLDPNQIRQVRNLIKEIAGKTTVLLSTHILPEVESTCGKVIIIHRGSIVGQGEPSDLRTQRESQQSINVEGRGPKEQFVSVLEGVVGVHKVNEITTHAEQQEPPLLRFRLDIDPELPVSESVFRAVADAGLILSELHREETSLEDVFASLTTEESAEENAAEANQKEVAENNKGDA